MGKGKTYVCPECGYTFTAYTGRGFLDQRIFEKDAFDDLSGMTGIDVSCFPPDSDFALRTVSSRQTVKCTVCGALEEHGLQQVNFFRENGQEADVREVPAGWKKSGKNMLVRQDAGICRHCGGETKPVPEEEFEKQLVCPSCHVRLEETAQFLWD